MRTRLLHAAAIAALTAGAVIAPAAAAPAAVAPAAAASAEILFADAEPAVTITAPSAGDVQHTATPTFGGTGASGASVSVLDDAGTELCATVVSGGVWLCESAVPMGDGTVAVTAVQTAAGEPSRATAAFAIDTASGSSFPLTEALAGGFIALLGVGAAVATAVHVRRQRRLPSN